MQSSEAMQSHSSHFTLANYLSIFPVILLHKDRQLQNRTLAKEEEHTNTQT